MKISIINTGGTFSKVYNPIKGTLEIRENLVSFLKEIAKETLIDKNYDLEYYQIIGKDSLDMTDEDRENLVNFIRNLKNDKILIIHGTDTIDKSAETIAGEIKDKTIILTGAMKPYSYNKVEASANFAQSIISFNFLDNNVYISLNGIIDNYDKIIKDRKEGYFKINK